jgi:hypothetical protein
VGQALPYAVLDILPPLPLKQQQPKLSIPEDFEMITNQKTTETSQIEKWMSREGKVQPLFLYVWKSTSVRLTGLP